MSLILRKIGVGKEEEGPEKLNSVGRLTLTMCGEKNESVIQACMHLGSDDIKTTSLYKLFEERVVNVYPKFKSKMKRQRFYKLKQMDVRDHIGELRMQKGQNSEQDLAAMVAPLMNKAFDMEKPLWEAYIIRNYGEGGTVLFVRVHHCIADGAALGRVLVSLCDTPPAMPTMPSIPIFEGWQWVGMVILWGCIHMINLIRVILKSCVTILGPSDPIIPHVKTKPENLSVNKAPVWTKEYKLDALKRLGRPFNATLNDVMLTVIAGALDRIRKQHSEAKQLRTYDVRCINPTNIRSTTDIKGQLDNQVSFLFPLLPLGIQHPIRRLQIVKQRMDSIKHMDEMGWMNFFVNITDMIPARYMRLACNWLTSKTTVAISNVRGPPTQLTVLGTPLLNTVAFLPAMHGIGYSFCIFSYNDTVRIGITVDTSLLKDPTMIAQAIDDDILDLESHVMTS